MNSNDVNLGRNMSDKNYRRVEYSVYRSRNNGQFWSNLTYHGTLNYDEAVQFADAEHSKHPSDWIRVVREEKTLALGYGGDAIAFGVV